MQNIYIIALSLVFFFGSCGKKEIDVYLDFNVIVSDINVIASNEKCITIVGKTNLPPSTNLMCVIKDKKGNFLGYDDDVSVRYNNTFESRFYGCYRKGTYIAEVTMVPYWLQKNKNVRKTIGKDGEFLVGKLVGNSDTLLGIVACKSIKFVI